MPPEVDLATRMAYLLSKLKLSTYSVRDAINFLHCISPDKKEQVLDLAKKAKPPLGLSIVLPEKMYTRESIEINARRVEHIKTGECHTLAQLGANHILACIEAKILPRMNVKIVAHVDGLGSHTFILLGQEEDIGFAKAKDKDKAKAKDKDKAKVNLKELDDLMKKSFLIIDPWAAGIGYDETQGVFTFEKYPYKGMTTKLTCVYDSSEDEEHQARLGLGLGYHSPEYKSVVAALKMLSSVSSSLATSENRNAIFNQLDHIGQLTAAMKILFFSPGCLLTQTNFNLLLKDPSRAFDTALDLIKKGAKVDDKNLEKRGSFFSRFFSLGGSSSLSSEESKESKDSYNLDIQNLVQSLKRDQHSAASLYNIGCYYEDNNKNMRVAILCWQLAAGRNEAAREKLRQYYKKIQESRKKIRDYAKQGEKEEKHSEKDPWSEGQNTVALLMKIAAPLLDCEDPRMSKDLKGIIIKMIARDLPDDKSAALAVLAIVNRMVFQYLFTDTWSLDLDHIHMPKPIKEAAKKIFQPFVYEWNDCLNQEIEASVKQNKKQKLST